jgi:hypothetical protein
MSVICRGCAHHQNGIGPSNVLQSIYVEPVKNSSLCPKSSGSLTTRLTKIIQQSIPLKLARKNEANTHLQIKIIDYS